ncbi:hypothetical protein CR513_10514, partial [Mucuna pruriens]
MAIVVEDGIIESRPCLISVLISIVFQPPSFTVFESETEIVCLYGVRLHSAETKPDYLCRDHLGSVSTESDSASAEEKSETESVRFHQSESTLSRDCVRFTSAKGESAQSLQRASRHSTLDFFVSLLFSFIWSITLMHSDTSNVPNSSDLDHAAPGSNGKGNKLYIVVVMYQPWYPQYPEWDGAWSYENYPSKPTVLPKFYGFARNTHHFDNGGSTASSERNEIVVDDNKRFEGYIDGCGMCGSVGHSFNDCPILQEPPPLLRPQSVQESSLEDLIKQLSMNNIQFRKNVSATQQPVQQLNNSPSLEDLVQQFQQNNVQFQQNIIAIVQELTAQIGQLATTINQLQFKDSGQVPSQVILSPQENISDIIMKSDMELPQQ